MNGKKLMTVLAIMTAMIFACCASVYALPQLDEIVSGDVEIRIENNIMNINASDNSIINFNSFDIMENETVEVNLPTESARILNRVLGKDMSQIFGSLNCNGTFILVNESGIHVGPNAEINAANLMLSTRDITDSDFLDGNYLFKRMNKEDLDRVLLNEGRINIHTGGIGILVAGAVHNDGIIAAPAGKIVLACGDAVKIDLGPRGLISVAILEAAAGEIVDAAGNPITEQIKNTGEINAAGGLVLLTGKSVVDIIHKTINLEGIVNATSAEVEGGVVRLLGDKDIEVKGTVKAEKIEIVTETKIEILDETVETSYLHLTADMFDVRSIAETTHIVKSSGDMKVDELIEAWVNSVTLIGDDFGRVSYIKDNNITLEVPLGDFDVAPGVIIPGHQVKIQAQRIGSYDNPVGINANITYINRISGFIDISEMWGLGTTLCIRGPAPGTSGDAWGAVAYNKDSHLILEAEKVCLIGENPSYIYGDVTFHNFECLIPTKEIYFEPGKTYTFKGTLDIGPHEQDYPVGLYSQVNGELWYIDIQTEEYSIQRVAVRDSININGDDSLILKGVVPIYASPSFNRGNNVGWLLNTAYWVGSSSNNWSDDANWDPIGKPGTLDDVQFDSTHSINNTSIIDEAFTIQSLTIDSSWASGNLAVNSALTITGNLIIDGGGLTGDHDVTIQGGSVTGDGVIDLTGGIFTLDGTGVFGGNTAWTFYNLTFGDGIDSETTSKTGNNKITVSNELLISLDQMLQAGTGVWNLSWNSGAETLNDISQISGGSRHTLALKSDGSVVYAWGSNYRGYLGDGTYSDRGIPVKVLGGEQGGEFLTGIVQVDAGEEHSMALASDGTVYAWGYNSYYRLGDGTLTQRNTPVKVRGGAQGGTYLNNIIQISTTAKHTLALAINGSVYAWGLNSGGSLGNGSESGTASTPIRVLGGEQGGTYLADIGQVAAGDGFFLYSGSPDLVGG